MIQEFAIGIDLGATNVKAVLIGENGEVLRKMQIPVVDETSHEGKLYQNWKNSVREIVSEVDKDGDVQILGLAAPGIPDKKNECIAYLPGRLEGIENFHWGIFLEKARVFVLNDAQSALLAESETGTGKGLKNVVMLTLGTGVGGGILIDGKLYQGFGQRAGHFGHIAVENSLKQSITGMPGSLEDAFGNSTMEWRSHGRFRTTQELVEAYQNGDLFAAQIWLDSVRKLAIGICSICNAVSPEMVILGGGIATAGDALFQPLEQFMEIYEWRPGGLKTPVRKASLSEFAGAIGAAFFALHKWKE